MKGRIDIDSYKKALKSNNSIDPLPVGEIKRRAGMKYIGSLADDESFVAMTIFKDEVYVAASRSIYKIVNDKLVPLEFELVESNEPQG